VLLNRKEFNERDFRRNHPGGSLGERLKVRVAEVMLTGAAVPRVPATTPLTEAIRELNSKNLGAVLVMNGDDMVQGILTDGDLRRLLSKGCQFETMQLGEAMTANPKCIEPDLLAADALSIMQRHEITVLPVTTPDGRLAGILHLQDLLGKGEFRFLV
ncbi:MAG: CBS domain-containing protein, partial [Thermodesulfobacteriota bacterium]